MSLLIELRRIIEDYFKNTTFTSANPTHTNIVRDLAYSYEPDEQALLEDKQPKEPTQPMKSGNADPNIQSQARKITASIKNPLGALEEFLPLAKLIPIISGIILLPEIITKIVELLRSPGFLFDVRFKRDIQNEVLQTFERNEKAKIRQGLTLIRITSSPTLRGENGIGQTGRGIDLNMARYDQDFEAFRKGVIP